MGDYFKPWRRKVGVAILLVACGLAFGSITALFLVDEFDSVSERLNWVNPGTLNEVEKQTVVKVVREADERNLLGVKFSFEREDGSNPVIIQLSPKDNWRPVQHWAIIISLVLLSVWFMRGEPEHRSLAS